MKTNLRSYVVLVLGVFAFSGAMSQKTTPEYDDMYYIPSEKKAVQAPVDPQAPAGTPATEPDDYEKYIQSLEQKRTLKKSDNNKVIYEDSVEYAEDQNYVDPEYYEEDGNTYVTNNYYGGSDYMYASRIRRFYDPFYSLGYYDSYYYDPFWYDPGWSFRLSFGYPYYGYGFSYGWPYYSYGYPYYSYWGGYNPYWRNPYYGYGYYGYYDYYGYHNHGGNNRPTYYGPRRTIESNRIASANGISTGGRRTVAGTSGQPNVKSTGTNVRRAYGSNTGNAGTSTVRRATTSGSAGTSTRSGTTTVRSSSSQERPVYTRPANSSASQNRSSSYSGSNRTSSGSTYSRPESGSRSGSSSSYSRPSSGSSSTYSRPSSSSSSTYQRSSSAPSYSSGGNRSSSYSSGSSGGGSRSYSSGSSGGGSRSYSGGGSSGGSSSSSSRSGGSSGSGGRR